MPLVRGLRVAYPHGVSGNLFFFFSHLTRCTAVCISFSEFFIPEPGIHRQSIRNPVIADVYLRSLPAYFAEFICQLQIEIAWTPGPAGVILLHRRSIPFLPEFCSTSIAERVIPFRTDLRRWWLIPAHLFVRLKDLQENSLHKTCFFLHQAVTSHPPRCGATRILTLTHTPTHTHTHIRRTCPIRPLRPVQASRSCPGQGSRSCTWQPGETWALTNVRRSTSRRCGSCIGGRLAITRLAYCSGV